MSITRIAAATSRAYRAARRLALAYLVAVARKTKDAPGRVTPKGTRPPSLAAKAGPRSGSRVSDAAVTGRYTAPVNNEYDSSSWWVPAIMLTFFGLGVIGILLNYLGVLPSSPSNWYLLGGLGCIVVGFGAATRYR